MTPLRTICALVAYDGTDFHGFQYQANAPTVQGVLEAALDRCCRREGRVVGAGRTDAGVHANGQVVSVSVSWAHTLTALERAWNVHLPAAVSIRSVREAPVGFHPRFGAISRTYRYTVQMYVAPSNFPAPKHSPLTDRYALLVSQPLDLAAMNAAAEVLIGVHDFATFGQATHGESTEREVFAAQWQTSINSLPALDNFPGQRLVFTITANAFLRQMVRNIVGTLLMVGRGAMTPAEVAAILTARDRRLSAPPAPPQGLVLESVTYPPAWERWVHGEASD
ncbi:MAG TPA: tRNA pseudouridine(38-40) synthase TruA [Chloroflexi bacterium]|nr:tRNA pseudouridine(38-40) synthase TruA [Chloroflexota bacterium]